MNHTERIWQLVGTFLPVYGIVLTMIAAVSLKRGMRIMALLTVPLLTFYLCFHYGEWIAYDGNMLYVSLALVYFLMMCLYYPVLLIFGTICFVRKSKTQKRGSP